MTPKLSETQIRNIIVIVIAIAVMLWIFRISRSYLRGLEEAAANAGASAGLPSPTLTPAQINQIVNKLFKHMDGPSSITDARIVENTFNDIPTESDLREVIRVFGCRKPSFFLMNSCETLNEWLRNETFVSITKINEILTAKGFSFQFLD
jgi:hypothetical protein